MAFRIAFSGIGRFPRDRVVYLKIQNNVPLRTLMQAVHSAFPETPPYRGEFREVIPHLTIATAGNDFELDQLEEEICLRVEAHRPLSVEAHSVIVAQENLSGTWSSVAELPLLRRRSSTHLDTEVGILTITRAGAVDFDAVMAILREGADWLAARGIQQWKHWHTEIGERLRRDRIEKHEVYLARLSGHPVATLTIQWGDTEFWGERGFDGLAGYVHGIAITRSVGGMRIGQRLLEWAVEKIAARGRHLARLDTVASNGRLCRYYEEHGFRPLGTVTLLADVYTGGRYTASSCEAGE
jgi:ribosomal protein S18 acetylase RimI-like enzyme